MLRVVAIALGAPVGDSRYNEWAQGKHQCLVPVLALDSNRLSAALRDASVLRQACQVAPRPGFHVLAKQPHYRGVAQQQWRGGGATSIAASLSRLGQLRAACVVQSLEDFLCAQGRWC